MNPARKHSKSIVEVALPKVPRPCKLLIAVALGLMAFASDSSASAGTNAQGWEQKLSSQIFGPVVICISDKGVKISYPQVSASVICKAPFDQLVWFNTKRRTICKESLNRFRVDKNLPAQPKTLAAGSFTRITYGSYPALSVTVDARAANDIGLINLLPSVKGAHKSPLVQCVYYFSKPIDVPKGALMFLDSFHGVPHTGGVLLALDEKHADGAIRHQWSTSTFGKATITPSTFDIPTGYSAVSRHQEVMMYDTSGVADLLKELDTDNPIK